MLLVANKNDMTEDRKVPMDAASADASRLDIDCVEVSAAEETDYFSEILDNFVAALLKRKLQQQGALRMGSRFNTSANKLLYSLAGKSPGNSSSKCTSQLILLDDKQTLRCGIGVN